MLSVAKQYALKWGGAWLSERGSERWLAARTARSTLLACLAAWAAVRWLAALAVYLPRGAPPHHPVCLPPSGAPVARILHLPLPCLFLLACVNDALPGYLCDVAYISDRVMCSQCKPAVPPTSTSRSLFRTRIGLVHHVFHINFTRYYPN